MVRGQRGLYHYAVDVFVDLLGQITGRRIKYTGNAGDIGAWKSFIKEYPNAGKTFVRQFIEYGLQSWFNDSIEADHSKNIRFSWIFGDKARKRWKAFDVETNIHITRIGLKKQHKLKYQEKSPRLTKLITELNDHEETTKKQFYGTVRGLLWCIANTTLYHHRSQLCSECVNSDECKQILKKEMSKVYKARGYGDC